MNSKKITLIGTTQGNRSYEIRRMFTSLIESASYIQLVMIDQSSDNIVSSLLVDFPKLQSSVIVINHEKCSLSHARNIALQYATGDIIGFCDDDAYYSNETILGLVSLWSELKARTLVIIPVKSSNNEYYANRIYPTVSRELSYGDISKYALSVGGFIFVSSRDELSKIKFNELLGAGAEFGGSEETELFFRLKSIGYKVKFLPQLSVYHDDDDDDSSDKVLFLAEKYKKYAEGYAVVLKKYFKYDPVGIFYEICRVITRSFVGLLFSKKRKIYLFRLYGIIYSLTVKKL